MKKTSYLTYQANYVKVNLQIIHNFHNNLLLRLLSLITLY